MTTDALRTQLLLEHPQDAARVLEQFPPATVAAYLEPFPNAKLADLFPHLSPTMASSCLTMLPDRKTARILRQMGVERAAIFLRRMKAGHRNRVMAEMPRAYLGMLKLVLRYPEGSVGQFMDPNPVTVNHQTRVHRVLEMIRDASENLENEIYVVDENHRLAGIVNVRDLITAGEDEPVSRIMVRPRYTIPARSRLGQVRSLVGRRFRDFYPVTDQNKQFIGILRYEILLEAFQESDPGMMEYSDLSTGIVVMAELFWNSFLSLLVPDAQSREKRGKDD